MALFLVLISVLAATAVVHVNSHGTVHDPVARQTRWRYDRTAPTNYDDNQLFCGGFNAQFGINKGKCGFCGDNWSIKTPRPHELGGKYGAGVIVKSYKAGEKLPVSVEITANHKGKFIFQLCNLDENNGLESEHCFEQNQMLLSNGDAEYYLPSTNPGRFDVELKIPQELRCNNCVLQWTYVAGNNWGYCGNGTGKLGCGPQEHFRACSDIRIY